MPRHRAYNWQMGSDALDITPTLAIPDTELIERFVRASGAGGQNVNKVSTAVELRFDLAGSPSLPEPVRERLLKKRDRRITAEGVLVIDAQRFRTQDRNRQDARERLAAFKVPVEVRFWPETLPRNANGKIVKTELKKLFEGTS